MDRIDNRLTRTTNQNSHFLLSARRNLISVKGRGGHLGESVARAAVSDAGLSIINTTKAERARIVVEERALTAEWAKKGQAAQLAPGYGLYFELLPREYIQSIQNTYFSRNGTFRIRVPQISEGRVRFKEYFIDGYVSFYMFSWEDVQDIGKRFNLSMEDLAAPGFDLDAFWNAYSVPHQLPNGGMPARPEQTIIDPLIDDHTGVYFELKSSNRGNVLVLNYDAHHDRGYPGTETDLPKLWCGNWAKMAERDGLARVVHIQSYSQDRMAYILDRNKIDHNWNTPSMRSSIAREIRAILAGENIQEVWLTVDFDAFSLDSKYHLSGAESEIEMRNLKAFLEELGIYPIRILPCSSKKYLNSAHLTAQLRGEKLPYIELINEQVKSVFASSN